MIGGMAFGRLAEFSSAPMLCYWPPAAPTTGSVGVILDLISLYGISLLTGLLTAVW